MGAAATEKTAASAIARAFCAARQGNTGLGAFPGPLPDTLAKAYAVQEAGIAAWPDAIAGWKVAGILPQFRDTLGADRLAGPAFARDTRMAGSDPVPFAVFAQGFAAIEAEFIFRMSGDVPAEAAGNPELLLSCIGALHAGMETAGSPFAGINEAGPTAIISDFGNNAGLIVGPAIADWQNRAMDSLESRAFINERCVGEGHAAKVADGPLAALRFLITHLASRGRMLKAGDYVSTGMTTGIHHVQAGDRIRLEFSDGIAFEAVAVDNGSPGKAQLYWQSQASW